jgi:glycosyltransferase involved in cell wall biosynthesis
MSGRLSEVVFAMTGDLVRNGRALRQIRVLKRLADRVHVVAGRADEAGHLLGERVHYYPYAVPDGSGVSFFWNLHRTVKSIVSTIDGSIYHASDLYVLPATESAAKQAEAQLVYDARELYPFVHGTTGKPWAKLFWSQLEGRFIVDADLVMTVSDSIAERLVDAYGVARPVVLHNVPDPADIEPSSHIREQLGLRSDDLVVLHLGQIREGRGGSVLVEAMRDVHGAVLVFIGNGPERLHLVEMVDNLGLDAKVRFLSPVPYDQVMNVAAGADVGVSLLEDTCLNHRFALPNKLFEYLMAGLPVVVSDFPELGRVVRDHDVGLAVDPASPPAVAAAIQYMVDEPQQRDKWRKNTYRLHETFGGSIASERLSAAYLPLLSGAKRRRHE